MTTKTDNIMKLLNDGKNTSSIMKDLSVSKSLVSRCRTKLKSKPKHVEEVKSEPEPEEEELPELTEEPIVKEKLPAIISDPEEPNKKDKEYVELKIIDGSSTIEKHSNLEALFDKLATPENIAIVGQVIGQILAAKVQTQAVSAPQWGFDDKGNPISF